MTALNNIPQQDPQDDPVKEYPVEAEHEGSPPVTTQAEALGTNLAEECKPDSHVANEREPSPPTEQTPPSISIEEPPSPSQSPAPCSSAAAVATQAEAFETNLAEECKPDSRVSNEQEPSPPIAQTHPNTPVEEPPFTPQSPAPRPSILAVAPRNVVFFGETGVGKSSIINMVREGSSEQSDADIATVSSDALGCTLVNTSYHCRLNDNAYTLWDTAGLVEGDFGHVRTATRAEENLVHLLQTIDGVGVSLLVYCIRARRFRPIVKDHYELFYEKTCGGNVPILLVVTGLENEENMEQWWMRNQREFERRGTPFTDCACITSTRGKAMQEGRIFDAEYEQSVKRLQQQITDCCSRSNKPVPEPEERWQHSSWNAQHALEVLPSQPSTSWTVNSVAHWAKEKIQSCLGYSVNESDVVRDDIRRVLYKRKVGPRQPSRDVSKSASPC